MRVKAKCWLNYNGVWHMGGEVFEVDDKDMESVKDYVSCCEDITVAFPPNKPKKRGRPKK